MNTLKVKVKISIQSSMVHLKAWKILVTMFFDWSYLHICRCIMWLMLTTWNYMCLLWSWIMMRMFKFLMLKIFLLNILMSCGNMLFFIEGWGPREEVMWSTFTWDLSECIQENHSGYKLGKWGSNTLTCLLSDSTFGGPKYFSGEDWSERTQNT